jgi:flagellar protein FlgJ
MPAAGTPSDTVPLARRRAESSPSAAPPGSGPGLDGEDSPDTPEEAARKFEKVLVRQFTKVMTDDMFSTSLAGEGGGKWMESQRDRQRDWMTDMITEQLVKSNSLGISETLMQKWKTGRSNSGSEQESPPDPSELPSPAPLDLGDPSGPFVDTPPTTQDESHIDHAV